MEISRDHSEIIYYNNQGDLKINKADRSLNGEYICHAKNVAGHSMMKINIEVISGKIILEFLDSAFFSISKTDFLLRHFRIYNF